MFFITGLPRSRTAWLANLFTYKNSYCFHELSRIGADPFQMLQKLRSRTEAHVGTSDQLAPYYIDFMAERLDDFRIVVIKRPKIECKISIANWLGHADYEVEHKIDELEKKIEVMQSTYETKEILYNDLNHPNVIKELWYHCVPSITFDEDRFDMLNEFNVQLIKEKYLPKLKGAEIRKLMEV